MAYLHFTKLKPIRTNFFSAIIASFFASLSYSQTAVPGGTISGVWTLAGSPYNVNGSLQVPNNDSLVIQPGVTVNFTGTHKLMVLGKIKAIGTVSDTIRFTCTNTATGWKGIRFNNTASSNDSSKLVYCRIEYGMASGPYPDDRGGAIFAEGFSKLRISRSTIINCRAISQGGGIYLDFSSPVISYNTIASNTTIPNGGSTVDGGGITIANGSPLIKGNLITKNVCSYIYGGGISNKGGIATVINNTITNHMSGIVEGAYIASGNLVTDNTIYGFAMKNSTITANTFRNNGTGVDVYYSLVQNNLIENNGTGLRTSNSATVINNRIFNNKDGGIVARNNSANSTYINNIIANNSSVKGGAMHFQLGAACYLYNNTIVNNFASGNGGAFYFEASSNPVFVNCIVFGNTAGGNGAQVYINDELSDPHFMYCDMQGGSPAFALNSNIFFNGVYANNIDTVPFFVSPSAGSGTVFSGSAADWRLQTGSRCINAGSPSGIYPATDIAGNPRIVGSFIDVGAHEYNGFTITGLRTFNKQVEVMVYPQPASDKIWIQSTSPVLSADLFSQTGQQLRKAEAPEGSIDLSSLSNGIYFLHIKCEEGNVVKKVLVNR